VRKLVEALCAPECAGRATGSAEGRAARAVVRGALMELGLEVREQPIQTTGGANLYAHIRGDGPALLLGAHYDHLGRAGRDVYWGADDNAAAVAIVVEVARRLQARPGRDTWIVAFDGEEPPHFLTPNMGSQRFVEDPPLPLDEIDLMVCLDLCGHALGKREVARDLFVLGAETSEGTAALVDSIAVDGLRVRRAGINLLPPLSDYHAFRERGVPFLFLTGGRWRHYHTPEDTPEKLDYGKMAATADWLEALARAPCGKLPRPFTDGRDDEATLRTLRAVIEAAAPSWPPAPMLLQRLDRIEVRQGRFTPDGFTEALMILAMVEAALA
jgi:Zn-dependent M28 family amino/carboxypeptidase